jgi:hypothetical protein
VHLDHRLEGLDAHAMKDRIAQNPGIVDHAVKSAKTVDRGLHDLAGGNGFGHGFEIRHRNAAALFDLLHNLFGRRGAGARAIGGDAGIVDHDFGAFGCGQQRDLPPDPAPSAGNDDDLAFE